MDDNLVAGDANALERERALLQHLLAISDDDAAEATEAATAADATDNFLTRLVSAAEATLDNWSLSILNARYGLYNRRSMTIEEIAIYSGLTVDMLRAHIDSALERLNEQGQREILEGRVDEPCARLVLYVWAAVRPNEEGATERRTAMTFADLPHLAPLLDLTDLPAVFTKMPDKQLLWSITTWLEVLVAYKSGMEFARQSNYGPVEEREFTTLVAGVEWPPSPVQLSLSEMQRFEPGPSAKVAHSILSRKSGFESHFADSQVYFLLVHLECNEQVIYYVERPLRVPNLFGDEGEPAFVEPSYLMGLQDGRVVLIDLTPPGEVVYGLHSARRLALQHYCRQQGYGLLGTDGRDTAHSHCQWPLRSNMQVNVSLRQLTAKLSGESTTDLSDLSLTHREMCGLVARENLSWVPGTHAVSTSPPGGNGPNQSAALNEAGNEVKPKEESEVHEAGRARDRSTGSSHLVTLLVNAVRHWLSGRDAAVLIARYGLEDGRARTLKEVGDQFGLSSARAGQIIERSFKRLTSAARSAQRRARYEQPCAQLTEYIRSTVDPDTDDDAARLLALLRAELPHLQTISLRDSTMLIARFLGDKETAEGYAKRVQALVAAEQEGGRKAKETERHDAKLDTLLADVIWPADIRPIAPGDYGAFTAARSVSSHVPSENGAFPSRKLDRLVEYESAAEHDFLQLLEGVSSVVFYQEQPFCVPYDDGTTRHIYPDVLFVLGDGRGIVVEVAPPSVMAQQENWVKWHGLRTFCRARGYGLLITDGRRTFQSVSRRAVRPEIRESLLRALGEGPMSWPEYQVWRDTSGVTTGEFYALVISERLAWRLRPYQLARN